MWGAGLRVAFCLGRRHPVGRSCRWWPPPGLVGAPAVWAYYGPCMAPSLPQRLIHQHSARTAPAVSHPRRCALRCTGLVMLPVPSVMPSAYNLGGCARIMPSRWLRPHLASYECDRTARTPGILPPLAGYQRDPVRVTVSETGTCRQSGLSPALFDSVSISTRPAPICQHPSTVRVGASKLTSSSHHDSQTLL